MIKVLIIVTSQFGIDGISNVVTNYYLYQDHSKIKMDLVTINEIPSKLKDEIKKNGDAHFIISYRNNNPLKYIIQLAKLCRKNKYDIIHIHGNSYTMAVELLAGLIGGIKTRIAHVHTTKCNHSIINKILGPIFHLTVTDRFACGHEAGKWLFKNKRFTIINNGIDLERFKSNIDIRNKLRNQLSLNNKLVIGHAGRFNITKNHKKLIDIFTALHSNNKDTALFMWGDGELIQEIKTYSQNINADIHFMGNSSELEKWLNIIDVIVFPSLYEGLPLFLIEAQAMGLSCIVSDTVSPEVKITSNLKFHPLNDTASGWAEDILHNGITPDNKVQATIANAGYDIRKNCKNILQIYIKLIDKHHKP